MENITEDPDLSILLPLILVEAAQAGLRNTVAPRREYNFTRHFVQRLNELKLNLNEYNFEVFETRQDVEGATGSDVVLEWEYQDFKYCLHFQIKHRYNNYEHYCNSLKKSEDIILRDLTGQDYAYYKGKSEADQEKREEKKTTWGTCKPWFDAVYKSTARSTAEVYQALAMQDIVAHEVKTQGSHSISAFLLFDEDVPQQVNMILLEEMAKVCGGKKSEPLTKKMMDNLNGDQLQTIYEAKINIIDPFPSSKIEPPFQRWLRETMAH